MVVYTMTKKQILRIISAVLFGLLVAAIIIFAVFNTVTASADERKLPIYCVDRGDNKIALTFDCAWGNSNTDELLSVLKNANAKATFFVTGEFCDKYPEDVKKFCYDYVGIKNDKEAVDKLICCCLGCVSDKAIIQLTDYLNLGADARFNEPSTLGNHNWTWRINKRMLTDKLAKKISFTIHKE